ncbi:chemotaxis protein [Malaciobacter molluscorum LMG 25693]|uniref:Cache sensor-containing MCP-domain signal transduction protein n=1 Tax=Malaciobacter molluscorum LMG 25693 TaxID=870501 RepID=A0A2G1DJF5_9BACT|nr:methyl-accepting chemotaxis protein [Malaciobacter molluscorum]AXX91672.1 Cache sensor-containing MCP-domain signal transduction protein [Malaciobacter molluscorum LMG 25693]PHO18534.1 chemotaxis protein [Malaciobacter molluscorum LMG 25693]
MKKGSIKSKILILLLISITISFVILGVNSLKTEYNILFENLEQKEIDLSKQSSKYIEQYVQSKIDILKAVADELPQDVSELTIDNKDIENKLRLASKSGNFVAVYVGYEENGNFLMSDGTKRTPQTTTYDSRKRDWYTQAVEMKKGGVTPPYVDFTTKKLVVSVFYPLMREGKLVGVVSSDIFIDTIVNTILNVKFKKTGFAYLLDEDGKILIHKDKKLLNKQSEVYNSIKDQETGFGEATYQDKEVLASYSKIPSANWNSLVQLDKKEIIDEIVTNIIKDAILYVILLVLILLILFYTMTKLLAPLKDVEDGLEFFFKYLKGEESVAKELNIKTNDEFGNMGRVIDAEIKQISKRLDEDRALIEEVKSVVNHINNGKLDILVKANTSNKALNELKDILNQMIENINANVNSDINPILKVLEEYANLDFTNMINNPDGKVSRGLNNLCTIINEMLKENKVNGIELGNNSKILLQNVDKLNKASNETAVSLEETAAAVEEITSTIINNTNRISDMSGHSEELRSSISEGNDLANSTVKSMDEINEQTQAIAEAITVIDQIAFQTNILSLNAAVEAATAGESGKGFAVVAQEVRNLASRSAEAAKEIKELVESATLKTDNGKQIADNMIKGYMKLNENIAKTTEAINDIATASKEQRTSIEQINDVITRLDQQTQSNASVATQTHDIAVNTSKVAQHILDTVNKKKFRE